MPDSKRIRLVYPCNNYLHIYYTVRTANLHLHIAIPYHTCIYLYKRAHNRGHSHHTNGKIDVKINKIGNYFQQRLGSRSQLSFVSAYARISYQSHPVRLVRCT
jgi:hypothetical protein